MKSSIGEEEAGRSNSEVGNRLLRSIWRVLRLVLVSYLLVLLAMTFLETWLVYPIPPVESRLASGRAQNEEVWFNAADGTKLFGWFAPQPNSKRAVLYCHGNGEDVATTADLLAELRRELDASVFLFDYRGYGHSEGRPNEAGCIADGLAAQRWLADRVGAEAERRDCDGPLAWRRSRGGNRGRAGRPGTGAR